MSDLAAAQIHGVSIVQREPLFVKSERQPLEDSRPKKLLGQVRPAGRPNASRRIRGLTPSYLRATLAHVTLRNLTAFWLPLPPVQVSLSR